MAVELLHAKCTIELNYSGYEVGDNTHWPRIYCTSRHTCKKSRNRGEFDYECIRCVMPRLQLVFYFLFFISASAFNAILVEE